MSPEDGLIEEVSKPVRAPRKRVVKPPVVLSNSTETVAEKKRAPRKRVVATEEAPVKTTRRTKSPTTNEAVARKAPTPLAGVREKRRSVKHQVIVTLCLLVVGIASSAVVGLTDKGQIDVNQTIEARNADARSAGNESAVIPVQNTNPAPDGGLIGMGIGGPENPPPAPATTTATTTATSTEIVGEAPLSNAEAEAAATASSDTPGQ